MGRLKLCPLVWKRGKIGNLFLNLVSSVLFGFSHPGQKFRRLISERDTSAAPQYERPARAGYHCARAVDRERWLQRTERLCVRASQRLAGAAHHQPERSDRASRALRRASSTRSASHCIGLLHRDEGKEPSQQIQSA